MFVECLQIIEIIVTDIASQAMIRGEGETPPMTVYTTCTAHMATEAIMTDHGLQTIVRNPTVDMQHHLVVRGRMSAVRDTLMLTRLM